MGSCASDLRGGKEAVGGDGGVHSASDAAQSADTIDLFLRSRGLGELTSQLELSISASKLCDRDIMSKSDPMAVIYIKQRDGSLDEISRTEVIMNTLNPVWITKIMIIYQFEIVQQLTIRIYDVDTKYYNIPVKTLKLNEQEFLGEASCALSEIVTRNDRSKTLKLQNMAGHMSATNLGTITIHAEESIASREAVEIILRCTNLINMHVFSKSDPFLTISKIVETGGAAIPICKTEVIDNNLNPIWKPVTLKMQQIVSKDNPLIIECYDFNSDGKHKLLGKLQKSLAELEKLQTEKTGANLFSTARNHNKALKSKLFVDKFHQTSQFTFVDYISNGFELNFMVAVDFTASNGHPRQSNSLHYIEPYGRLNAYQQSIMEVGEVIQFYDSDKLFSAWGFGGRPSGESLSHCFNLNGVINESEVAGVEGIMSAYSKALQTVVLSGPTLFGPVIQKAAQIASNSLSYKQNKYFVLLIITDGVITDLEETKNAIILASDLPLSILIIGVGSADFKAMEILDADNGKRLVSETGRVATRDIVQFVPMREIHAGQISIAQSLLEELPGQFLTYMRSRNIKPLIASEAQASHV